MKILLSAATFLIAAATSTPVLALVPGQYNIGGIQEICLQAGPNRYNSWYGTSFPAWGGRWRNGPKHQFVFGNYNGGAGNDSIVVTSGVAIWTEWTDTLSFRTAGAGQSFTFIKATCDPPAAPGKGAKRNPLD